MAKYFTCKDCPDRKPACHGSCEKYKKESANWEKAKEYVRSEDDYWNYKFKAMERISRLKKKH